MVAFVLLGAVLRLVALGNASLTMDEGVSLHMAGLPLGTLADMSNDAPGPVSVFHFVSRFDAHPPLFYVALHAWIGLVGTPAEWLLRLPFALCSVAALGAACLLARRLLPAPAARTAMLLAACSQASVWCAQEIRMYAMLAMFVSWAAWFGARAWLDDWRPGWAGWVLLSLAGACTHYLGGFAVVAFAVWTLRVRPATPSASRWRWGALLFIALGFLAWSPVLLFQTRAGHGPPALAGVGPARMFDSLPSTLVDLVWGPSLPLRLPAGAPIALAAVATLGLALWGARHTPREGKWLAALQLAVPVLLLLGVGEGLGRNLLQPRFFMYLAPFTSLLLAPLVATRAGRVAVALIVAVNAISLASWYLDPTFQRQPLRAAAEHVRAFATTEDLVLVEDAIGIYPIRYYLPAEICPALVGVHPVRLEDGSLAAFLKGRRTIWLVLSDAWVVDPENRVFGWLASRATVAEPPRVFACYDPSHSVVVFRFEAHPGNLPEENSRAARTKR